MSILDLQSGSDVRGTATGKDVKFTEEAAYKIGAGFTSYPPRSFGESRARR